MRKFGSLLDLLCFIFGIQEMYREEKEKLLELEQKFAGLQGDFNEI